MRYEGSVYRPPSEASSLIIQLTIGCARNTCTFCGMYKDKKFRIRPLKDVIYDLELAREHYGDRIKRVFFADGDALIVKNRDLLYIFNRTRELFTSLERITVYGTPKDILEKSILELVELKKAGLDMVYVGAESGDDNVLREVKKGVSHDEIRDAILRLREANIKSSMTLISGLGGMERRYDHAINSARLISECKPNYVGFLTLMVEEGTEMAKEVLEGNLRLLTPEETLNELKIIVENVDAEGTVFRSNHASNYLSLAGTFNKDRERLLEIIESAIKNQSFKPEYWRGL